MTAQSGHLVISRTLEKERFQCNLSFLHLKLRWDKILKYNEWNQASICVFILSLNT